MHFKLPTIRGLQATAIALLATSIQTTGQPIAIERRWLSLPPLQPSTPPPTGPTADTARATRDAVAYANLDALNAASFPQQFADLTYTTAVKALGLDSTDPGMTPMLDRMRQTCQADAAHLLHYLADSMARRAGQTTYGLLDSNHNGDDLDPQWPGTGGDSANETNPSATRQQSSVAPNQSSSAASIKNTVVAVAVAQDQRNAADSLINVVASTWQFNHYNGFNPPADCQSPACNTLRQALIDRKSALQQAMEDAIGGKVHQQQSTIKEASVGAVYKTLNS